MLRIVWLLTWLLIASSLQAEIKQSVKLNLFNTIAHNPDRQNAETLSLGGGSADFNLQSIGNKNVRSYLTLASNLDYTSTVTVERAYIKTRYEQLRFTVGKTRLSWGEGAVFNAGDVIMGGSDLNVDLTATEFRQDSRWLASGYKSFGRFSFVEVVFMPPRPNEDPAVLPQLGQTLMAVRNQFQIQSLGNTRFELGYSLNGNNHQPYFSLQGGKGLNWHLSGNWQSPQPEHINLSGGLYSVLSVGDESSLSFRSELLYKSSGQSSEVTEGRNYKTYGYLDLSFSKNSITSYFARTIISPIDRSGLLILGSNMNLYQGFNVYSNVSIQNGDQDDTFATNSSGAISLTVGLNYVF